eukprot:scaffold12167_cov73-Phaeocystis_antarctica.AAC.1
MSHTQNLVSGGSCFFRRNSRSASTKVVRGVARNQLTNTVASPTCGDPCFRSRSHMASPSTSDALAMWNWLV